AANDAIRDIATATDRQADAISQVTQGVEQVSAVVQTNSATAEQSAAASEELSGQAQMLKDLVGQFQLEERNESQEDFDEETPKALVQTPAAPDIDLSFAASDKY
ncbi:MAG: methyl-accepting chemotaxis protein, partial [Oscillospiraceae bacterium]|nr:methyl-accepting chemotaxis protein [Oscillospiraceae bacterium]